MAPRDNIEIEMEDGKTVTRGEVWRAILVIQSDVSDMRDKLFMAPDSLDKRVAGHTMAIKGLAWGVGVILVALIGVWVKSW